MNRAAPIPGVLRTLEIANWLFSKGGLEHVAGVDLPLRRLDLAGGSAFCGAGLSYALACYASAVCRELGGLSYAVRPDGLSSDRSKAAVTCISLHARRDIMWQSLSILRGSGRDAQVISLADGAQGKAGDYYGVGPHQVSTVYVPHCLAWCANDDGFLPTAGTLTMFRAMAHLLSRSVDWQRVANVSAEIASKLLGDAALRDAIVARLPVYVLGPAGSEFALEDMKTRFAELGYLQVYACTYDSFLHGIFNGLPASPNGACVVFLTDDRRNSLRESLVSQLRRYSNIFLLDRPPHAIQQRGQLEFIWMVESVVLGSMVAALSDCIYAENEGWIDVADREWGTLSDDAHAERLK